MKRKLLAAGLALIVLLIVVTVVGTNMKSNVPVTELPIADTSSNSTDDAGENSQIITEAEPDNNTASDKEVYLGNDPNMQEHPKAPELTWIKDLSVPEYSGEAYILLNDGIPFFETEGLNADPWEIYYDLDELGRCTLAEGVFGPETMPTEKRGSISSIKPTGWHSDKYPQSLVDGESLYNRCHLVAFALGGETANKYNLVTGTRYFNKDGINALENMMIDYIRETGNHIRYRVTPVFSGDNLICDGQVAEAWSIEDEGEAICFCIWSYNVQPGITIDYLTGDNWLSTESGPKKTNPESESSALRGTLLDQDIIGTFILNTKKKTIHSPDCQSAANISDKNKKEYYGSYNDLIKQGYVPDNNCLEIN